MKTGYVYIIGNRWKTTLYIGVTSNLKRRILEHKAGCGSGFSKRYNLNELLYFEVIPGMLAAIAREKQLKNWHRDWKWNLVKKTNPKLKDLAEDWYSDQEIFRYKSMKKGDSETSSE